MHGHDGNRQWVIVTMSSQMALVHICTSVPCAQYVLVNEGKLRPDKLLAYRSTSCRLIFVRSGNDCRSSAYTTTR